MTIETAKQFLLWCLVINYGVLLWWFFVFRFGYLWMFWIHSRWFQLSKEHFDTTHYVGMALYKVGILLFNLIPYIVLVIVSHNTG